MLYNVVLISTVQKGLSAMCMCAKLSLTLCDPMDPNPPGFSVPGISRQECWSGLPVPPPGDLPDPGIKPVSPASPALQADSLPAEPSGKPFYCL